jgi:hypothetical protein
VKLPLPEPGRPGLCLYPLSLSLLWVVNSFLSYFLQGLLTLRANAGLHVSLQRAWHLQAPCRAGTETQGGGVSQSLSAAVVRAAASCGRRCRMDQCPLVWLFPVPPV